MHPYLNALAAAERRKDLLVAAQRHRSTPKRDPRTAGRVRRLIRRLPRPGYASFGFLARLGATRGGSPGIFG
jgi:hypothetical protein